MLMIVASYNTSANLQAVTECLAGQNDNRTDRTSVTNCNVTLHIVSNYCVWLKVLGAFSPSSVLKCWWLWLLIIHQLQYNKFQRCWHAKSIKVWASVTNSYATMHKASSDSVWVEVSGAFIPSSVLKCLRPWLLSKYHHEANKVWKI